jgi:hypothetical protein
LLNDIYYLINICLCSDYRLVDFDKQPDIKLKGLRALYDEQPYVFREVSIVYNNIGVDQ